MGTKWKRSETADPTSDDAQLLLEIPQHERCFEQISKRADSMAGVARRLGLSVSQAGYSITKLADGKLVEKVEAG